MSLILNLVNNFVGDWYEVRPASLVRCLTADCPESIPIDLCEKAYLAGQPVISCGRHSNALALLLPDLARKTAIVPYADITVGDQVGEGGFATVYKGTWKGIDIAFKRLKQGSEVVFSYSSRCLKRFSMSLCTKSR